MRGAAYGAMEVSMDRPPADLAIRALAAACRRNLTIVTAESCTAGRLSAFLSEAPGAAEHLHGSFVAWTSPQCFFRGTRFPFLRALDSDRLLAAFHLAALSAFRLASFVTVHLAFDFNYASHGNSCHSGFSSGGTKVVDQQLSGIQRKLRPAIKISLCKPRWGVGQSSRSEMATVADLKVSL